MDNIWIIYIYTQLRIFTMGWNRIYSKSFSQWYGPLMSIERSQFWLNSGFVLGPHLNPCNFHGFAKGGLLTFSLTLRHHIANCLEFDCIFCIQIVRYCATFPPFVYSKSFILVPRKRVQSAWGMLVPNPHGCLATSWEPVGATIRAS
jgi:hypothetical protein